MATTTAKIGQQVDRLNTAAAAGNSTARIQLDTAIDQLEKETRALATQLVPGGRVPLYVTPQSDQSRLDYTTWNELDPTGPYGAYDDNYCRANPSGGNGKPVYPRRDPASGRVSLEPCTGMLGPDVQRIANIKEPLTRLTLLAKHRLLTEEAASADSMRRTRETAEGKIAEYERATRQYQKLATMIDSFQEVSQRHRLLIDKEAGDVAAKENRVAVMQDDLETYLGEQQAVKERNERIFVAARGITGILWLITLALFLLKQV